MRTIIADDEPLARRKLRLMLGSEPGVQIVAECENGAQTVQALSTYKPDLLMLDVQMPDLDGFEVLSSVPQNETPVVIFTTAYDRHAVRAFEEHALDYLLKPFDEERLHRAIDRVRSELLKKSDQKITYSLLNYVSKGVGKSRSDHRLVIKTGGRVVFLSCDEVDWVEAAANYVRLNVGKQSYLLREGIGQIAERLDPDQFIRIHRSVIVNIQKIKELQPVNSGEYIVVLKDGKELSCSRGYRAGLQRFVEGAF